MTFTAAKAVKDVSRRVDIFSSKFINFWKNGVWLTFLLKIMGQFPVGSLAGVVWCGSVQIPDVGNTCDRHQLPNSGCQVCVFFVGGLCTGCVVVCKMVKMCNCLNLKACNHGNIKFVFFQVLYFKFLGIYLYTPMATNPVPCAGTKWSACSRLLWDSCGTFQSRSGRKRLSRILFLDMVCVCLCVDGFPLVPKFPRISEGFVGRLACALWIT